MGGTYLPVLYAMTKVGLNSSKIDFNPRTELSNEANPHTSDIEGHVVLYLFFLRPICSEEATRSGPVVPRMWLLAIANP